MFNWKEPYRNDQQPILTKEEYNSDTRRLVRIETMLFNLCVHLGIDPRGNKKEED